MQIQDTIQTSTVQDIRLNRLKASPRNARKTKHTEAAIEALAASIAAKGVLQPLVVEPETDETGAPTGSYLVTIGEGRRQALLRLAKRKAIRKTHPVRCIVDVENDAHEISLDENVTRSDMHPADQFEAFLRLAQERGYGPEEIAARFGVTAAVVRQRLKLATVSPNLVQAYRDELMTLDQQARGQRFCMSHPTISPAKVWALSASISIGVREWGRMVGKPEHCSMATHCAIWRLRGADWAIGQLGL